MTRVDYKISSLFVTFSYWFSPNNDQNGDTTIINSFPNLSEHASEASTKRKMMEIDSSGIHDSTTEAEKRMYTPDIQKVPTNRSSN